MLLAACAGALLTGCGEEAAPASQFVLLDGSTRQTSDFLGNVLLLNFWATSCTTCVAEMPELASTYRKFQPRTSEELVRALMLSHLTAIYIKQSLGTLSALCGCVVASIGSSCGITYLMGGNYERICYSVKNMIANLTGMICDGAKPACSLKISSGVSTALLSSLLAMEGKCVTSSEGIVDDDVDRSIHNLTSIGADAMCKTDDMVLQIMASKGC